MEFNKKNIALVIQNARRNAGLKQAVLAEKIGISEKHLSKIETGKNYPALDNFFKIIDVLNLTLGDFGLKSTDNTYQSKLYLQKIIDNSSKKQLDIYADVILALQNHV